MCDGFSEAMAIAAVVSAVAGSAMAYQGQQQQAKAQSDQNAKQSQLVNQATINSYTQAQSQIGYHNQEAYQQEEQSAWNSRAANAKMLTSAGDSGVSTGSISVGALSDEYANRNAEFQSDAKYNLQNDTTTLQDQMQGFQSQGQSQINMMKVPNYPSAFGAGLSIAGAGLNSWKSSGMSNYAKGWGQPAQGPGLDGNPIR